MLGQPGALVVLSTIPNADTIFGKPEKHQGEIGGTRCKLIALTAADTVQNSVTEIALAWRASGQVRSTSPEVDRCKAMPAKVAPNSARIPITVLVPGPFPATTRGNLGRGRKAEIWPKHANAPEHDLPSPGRRRSNSGHGLASPTSPPGPQWACATFAPERASEPASPADNSGRE